ncbi:MAG: FeoA family protein [Anaerolineae bacterium]|nr:ferrous iron transport protein A [Anaerolineae bacterium]
MQVPIRTLTLDSLKAGETGIVTALAIQGAERHRLLDLGVLVGTHITVEMISPLGDPIAYGVRGTLIALRRSQARQIQVQLAQAEDQSGGIEQ